MPDNAYVQQTTPRDEGNARAETSDVTRRVCLVVGGGSGIGREVALQSTRAGDSVWVADLADVVDGSLSSADGIRRVTMDVCDDSAADRVVSHVMHAEGRLDRVVFSAGVAPEPARLADCDITIWQKTLDLHLLGLVRLLTTVARLANDGVQVAVLSSLAGVRPSPKLSPYAAAKAAQLAVVRSVAQEAGAQMKVIGFCPGPTATRMWDALEGKVQRAQAPNQPEDVAQLILRELDDPQTRSGAVFGIESGTHFEIPPVSFPVSGESSVISARFERKSEV